MMATSSCLLGLKKTMLIKREIQTCTTNKIIMSHPY